MNGCRALLILLICIRCMTPLAFMHVSVYARAFGNTAQRRSASSILCNTHSGIHTHTTCTHARTLTWLYPLVFCANIAVAKWVQCGIAWDCRCAECFFTTGIRQILPMVKSTAAHQQLPNVHPNLSRLQPARPSLSLMGSCAAVQGYVRSYKEALQCPCSASGAGR